MSKIFEALQGARSEVSELLPSLVGDDSTSGPPPISATGPAAAAHAAAPPPVTEMERGDRIGHGNGIRKVRLAIPVSVPVLPFEDAGGLAAEQYRIARTKLAHHPQKPRLIAVTSPGSGDGKTVSAINLAGVLSLKASAEVLLVDIDFRRSSAHALLGLAEDPGLAEVIAGECAFEEAVVEAEEYPHLHFLASGEPKSNPSEMLETPRWHAFCALARGRYEYVIFDTPPIGSVADCDLIQMAADGVVMVVRPDHTQRGGCLKALEAIPKEKLLGVLLNAAEEWPLGKRGAYGYGYGYGQGQVGYRALPVEARRKPEK